MKNNILIAALLLLFTFQMNAGDLMVRNFAPANRIDFYDGSFESAKVKAKGEGKLFFVDFYANWCTPCKWMEESAFSNSEVVELMRDNYVPYKVDIDKPEGYSLKKEYQVKMLPTMLIFNKDGEIVARVEETLDAQKLKQLLSFHATNNVKGVEHKTNTSPLATQKQKEKEDLENLYKNYKQHIESGKTTFHAQVGIFSEYREAYTKVKDLKKTFLEPIVVMTKHTEGTTYYKVLLGQFKSIEEANSFCQILIRDHNLNAIVH